MSSSCNFHNKASGKFSSRRILIRASHGWRQMRRYVCRVTQRRGDLLASETVLRLEVLGGRSGGQVAKDRRDIYSGSSQARLSRANRGIHRNAWKHFYVCASCDRS
jgi:hypothetical protein